jgi:hypothetical protein
MKTDGFSEIGIIDIGASNIMSFGQFMHMQYDMLINDQRSMLDRIKNSEWYHGTPYDFKVLKEGSTITPYFEVAKLFSKKPGFVISSNNSILHNGVTNGYVYQVNNVIPFKNIYPHPRSSMPKGFEWITVKNLQVARYV